MTVFRVLGVSVVLLIVVALGSAGLGLLIVCLAMYLGFKVSVWGLGLGRPRRVTPARGRQVVRRTTVNVGPGSAIAFELWAGERFRRRGYSVKTTPATGDHGV